MAFTQLLAVGTGAATSVLDAKGVYRVSRAASSAAVGVTHEAP